MKKLLLIFVSILFISCNDDCEGERNAIEERYNELIEHNYNNTPVDEIQIKALQDERDKAIAALDC